MKERNHVDESVCHLQTVLFNFHLAEKYVASAGGNGVTKHHKRGPQ